MNLDAKVDSLRKELLLNIILNLKLLNDGSDVLELYKKIDGLKLNCYYEHRSSVEILKINKLIYFNSEKSIFKVKYMIVNGETDYVSTLNTDTLVLIDKCLINMVETLKESIISKL